MPRRLVRLALIVLVPLGPVGAVACPADAHGQVDAAAAAREAGTTALETLNSLATGLVRACPGDRALAGHVLAMFTRAGLAADPPERYAAHRNAFRTVAVALQAGGDGFDDVAYGDGLTWSVLDERNAYFDLMLAMSTDFLVASAHEELYAPGTTERAGCGLYPEEEAAALAVQGEGNADGGELVVRVGYLGRSCDVGRGEVAGQVARYFAAHYRARAADPEYLGLTAGDIRAGLQRFLPAHLAAEGGHRLFSDDEAAELLAF